MMRTKRSQDAWFDGDAMGTAGLCVLLRGVAIEAAQALRRGGSMLLFCDWRMVSAVAPAVESAGFRQRGLIVWDKGSLGQGSLGFRPQHELILWYIKGDMSERPPGLRTRGNVLHHKRVPPAARIHPTEKPVALLRDLIECTVPEGGLIADPFAGSGALGVAALEMGRRALLSDADPRWVEAMEARFAVSPGQATGTG
jgi:site-specific DNA-methyltransferase (adenine-specific)